MTIGERIKQRRIELGLSQAELASLLGYKSKVSISHAENDRDDMTTTRIAKYAKALKVKPSYLMGWDEEEALLSQANSFKNTHMFEVYELFGWEAYHLLDVLDCLPAKGRQDLLDIADFFASKNGVTSQLSSQDDIEALYKKNLNVQE